MQKGFYRAPIGALTFFLVVLVICFPRRACAQFFTGPIASATGGAGRAAVDGSESAFLNPASVVSLNKYFISGIYGAANDPANGGAHLYGVSLADGTPGNLFPGALSYIHRYIEGFNGFTDVQQDMQIAAGIGLFHRCAFGLAGHQTTDLLNTGTRFTQTNMNAGLLIDPLDNLGLAATIYNILRPSADVPAAQQLVPTYAIGGHLIIQKTFRIRLDLVRPDRDTERTNVMMGIETYFTQGFALRLGEMWQETQDQRLFTAGLGYKGPNLSFDYAYQRDMRTGNGETHSIDIWVGF